MRLVGALLALLVMTPAIAAAPWDIVVIDEQPEGATQWHPTSTGLVGTSDCRLIQVKPGETLALDAGPCDSLFPIIPERRIVCLDGDIARLDAAGAVIWRHDSRACTAGDEDAARGVAFIAYENETTPWFASIATGSGQVDWQNPLWPGTEPARVHVTQGGLAIIASIPCRQAPECSAIDQSTPATRVLLFDRAGAHLGNLSAAPGRIDSSVAGVVDGATIWMRLGAEAVGFDPLQGGQATRIRIDPLSRMEAPGPSAPAPVLTANGPLFPVRDQVIQINADAKSRGWTWTAPEASRIIGGVALDEGSGWLTDEPALHVLDGRGVALQRLPLPAGTDTTGGPVPFTLHDSQVHWLGQTTAPPWPNTHYPALDEPVTFFAPDAAYVVAAGDEQTLEAPGDNITIPAADRWLVTGVSASGATNSVHAHIYPGALPSATPGALDGIAVSSFYPAVAVPVTLMATDPAINELFIGWPDGLERLRAADGELITTRTFPGPGSVDVTVTAVFKDGHSEAVDLRLDVGGHRASPNALERAFAPENQDMTWGFIGLGVALAGATSGILIQRKRRARGQDRLARLDRIRAQARSEPYDAIAALVAEAATARHLHRRGVIDDAQYALLTDRCQDIVTRIMSVTVDTVRPHLSQPFLSRLDAIVQDGILDSDEGAELRQLLEAESIGGEQRAVVRRFIDAWQVSVADEAGPKPS